MLGLSEAERATIGDWAMHAPGRALWKLDNAPGMQIQTVLSPTEKSIFDTDSGMRARARTAAADPDDAAITADAGDDPA
ncbi:hypothetical protein FVA95_24765 [Pseudonocardia sp. EV170527-09]|uniref:hypothetical protein n=1 Tax=Pseudonocardia sp. EV170527-09 TaxID=2603411 RepID=UPI0011F3FFB2|nr:hypothetical protein [Pseudonocardia sp. EV170527-09]KAA1017481.1 hypothetical protein FVA95_24765 [Pseudonocardia sp. EV170527-09]